MTKRMTGQKAYKQAYRRNELYGFYERNYGKRAAVNYCEREDYAYVSPELGLTGLVKGLDKGKESVSR